MRVEHLQHRFVEFIPECLEEGVLYVSIEYMTVAHKCCCGCGEEVSTTLSPTDWRLIFDGKTVSLEPSIGSWSLPCRSHYFITRNRVRWAPPWTRAEIDAGRSFDAARKRSQYEPEFTPAVEESIYVPEQIPVPTKQAGVKSGFWSRVRSWWS